MLEENILSPCYECDFRLTGELEPWEAAAYDRDCPWAEELCFLRGPVEAKPGCRWFSPDGEPESFTKANFRGIREQIGLSQASIAEELGVNVKSVKRWEDPEDPHMPPADAWAIAINEKERFDAIVKRAVDELWGMTRKFQGEPDSVQLVLYRSQEGFEERVSPEKRNFAEYTQVNAATRVIASLMESQGFKVEWSFQDDEGSDWLRRAGGCGS